MGTTGQMLYTNRMHGKEKLKDRQGVQTGEGAGEDCKLKLEIWTRLGHVKPIELHTNDLQRSLEPTYYLPLTCAIGFECLHWKIRIIDQG